MASGAVVITPTTFGSTEENSEKPESNDENAEQLECNEENKLPDISSFGQSVEGGILVKAGNCSQCGAELPKYTCPKCAIKTCSVACCKQHKEIQKCDGVRSTVPQFVPILGYSAYSERLSVEDQCFLQSVRMRAQSENALKSLKRACPVQQQPAAFKALEKHFTFENAKRPALSVTTESLGDTALAAVSTDKPPQLPTLDALSPANVSDPYKRQALLTTALQRRIWLNLDGKGCGETKFDKVSETLFWTVDVQFLYSVSTMTSAMNMADVTASAVNTSASLSLSTSVQQDAHMLDSSATDTPTSEHLTDSSIADVKKMRDVPIALMEDASVADASVADPSVADASVADPSVADASVADPCVADAPVAVASTLKTVAEASKCTESDASIESLPSSENLIEVEKTYTVHNIPETLSVSTLIRQFVRPKPFGALVTTSDIDMEKMKPFIEAACHDNGIMIYMKVPCGDNERYYVVDPSRSLLENLRNRFVDGYPTFIVTVSNQYDQFTVLTETEARELFERLHPSMGYRATEPNHNRRPTHSNPNSGSNGGYWTNNRSGRFCHNYSSNNNNNYRSGGGNRNGGRNFYNNNHRGVGGRNFNNVTNNSHHRHGHGGYNHHNNRQGFRERPTDLMERFLDDPRFNINP